MGSRRASRAPRDSLILPMKPNENCPFCEPNRRRAVFLENEAFAALYNGAPILPGHSLVIPQRHVTSVMELSDEALAGLFLFARRVARLLADVYHCDSFDWTVQDGESAGQTVAHLHVHIIPRQTGDLPHPGDWYPKLIDSDGRPRLSWEDFEKAVARLRVAAANGG